MTVAESCWQFRRAFSPASPDGRNTNESGERPSPRLGDAAVSDSDRRQYAPATLRILVVEDDVAAGRALARLLSRRGHLVEHVADLAGARDALATERDVVLLDLMLPDGSGKTLLPTIRAGNPRARVIVTTGMSDRRTLADVLASGADRILTKPIDFAELLSTL